MLSMAWKVFKRDWRSGEVKVLFFALMIAVTAMVAIGSITDRVHRSMGEQSSEFLGADYTVSSAREIDSAWIDKGLQEQLNITAVKSFGTVLSKGDNFQLVRVRSLDGDYPLRGYLEIAKKPFSSGRLIQGLPERGKVWVEPRVLNLLDAKVGDQLEFGLSKLIIDGVIVSSPGQASEVFSVAPRAIINSQDLAASEVIQAGSRVTYGLFIAGDEKPREAYINWLKEQKNSTQRITGGKEGTPALKASIERAEVFLRLASLVSVMLAGVAIAVAAGRYSRRNFDYAAIYRCLGMQMPQLNRLYFWQLLLIGVIGSGLGVVLGLLIQNLLIFQFADYLPKPMVALNWLPVLVSFLSGLVVLIGFALPSFLQIAKVSPLRVLRKEIAPSSVSSWMVYALSISTMALLMWWQSQSWQLVGTLLVVALIAFVIIRLFAWLIFKIGLWLGKRSPTSVRYGLGQLKRYPAFTISQISAFGLAFIIMLSVFLIRTELMQAWQSQLPDDAPNHFLVNVQSHEVPILDDVLKQESVQTAGIYPMILGRVTELNDQAVSDVLSEQQYQQTRALQRELNLTWMDSLPKANTLIDGEWWDAESDSSADDVAGISIAKELQQMMQLKLGDKLTFTIGGMEVKAVVKNVREIQWDSFQPNFFVIFEPKAIEHLSATYITSFKLEPSQKPLLNSILQQMPTVTIIELDKIMQQVQQILEQVTLAVEFIMLFVLLAGIAVLYAVLQANRDERLLSATLLKTLGAQRKFIRASLVSELALLGLFAGALGVIGAEVMVASLYQNALDIDPVLHPLTWIFVPLLSMGFISLIGWWGLRGLLNEPAHKVLREL